ncbi:MAG: hypothetical protein K8T91_10200 [Planctomycetes bacterium]|nr:hypothetical protein [Planctomycetota bacterium]
MERIDVTDAQRDFAALVNRVYQQGVCVDVERDTQVIARLSPVRPPATLKVRDLPMLLARLPRLEEDAARFGDNLRAIRRQFPTEGSSWDG